MAVTDGSYRLAMDGSDNVRGAENQQERLWTNGWVVGFVDGEGCFSCPIFQQVDDDALAGPTHLCGGSVSVKPGCAR